MAEQCIVCLGDLRESLATLDHAETPEHLLARSSAEAGDDGVSQQQQQQKSLLRNTTLTSRYNHLLTLQAAARSCT
jgi:hypothetical protein